MFKLPKRVTRKPKAKPLPERPRRKVRNPCKNCSQEERIPEADHGLCWGCQGDALKRIDPGYLDIDKCHKDLVPDHLRKLRGKGRVERVRWTSKGSDFRA